MTLDPIWRTRVFAGVAAVAAVFMGFSVANGALILPLLFAAAIALFVVAQWQPFSLITLLLALAMFGYVVGNRGFAQLMLLPGFPLLPAEAILAFACPLLLVHSAWRREAPVRRDALNLLIVAWIAVGVGRMVFDFRAFGFWAVRDFATVYYAAFFFLAQEAARQERNARVIQTSLLIATGVLFGINLVYERNLDFFFGTLTFRGSPLIAYKGDLIGTFLAVGSVLFFLRFEAGGKRANIAVSLALAAATLASNNRASMLGLAVAAAWLAAGRRWRFAAVLGGSGAIAAIVILMAAAVTNTSWQRTPVYGVYERIASLFDPAGERVYRVEETSNKGDNNVFRRVWWQAVFDETVEENALTGLGFGRDLADRFVREYYPESTDDFNVRSPHNILLTVFARMGALGLAIFLAMLAVMARHTWSAVRVGPQAAAPWCAAWTILTSACFGVVLEGPMGAVVFWTLLGLGSGERRRNSAEAADAE
ncbi:MAG TPA: O-antigen ligase family protein [Opitutus sp.]|nr:O-antigen ligase family protein [Opitutus sp.]